MQYDAIEQPDPEIWLELDEAERVDLVIDYHRRIGVQLENPELHAVAHVVVENRLHWAKQRRRPRHSSG